MRQDATGLFWATETPSPRSRQQVARTIPPLPDTGWELPEGEAAFPSLQGQGVIAIDCETYDPDIKTRGPGAHRDGRLVGIAVGTEAGFRQYYPIGHEQGPNLPRDYVLAWLRRELAGNAPKIGANLLYDLAFLAEAGVQVAGPFYDVQVAEPLLDETRLTYSLESIAQHHLGEGKREDAMSAWLSQAYGPHNVKGNIWRAPATLVGPYAEGDVDLPLRIFAKQRAALEAEGLWDLFLLESKLIPMLLAMRRRGVRVDLDYAEALHKDMTTRRDGIIKEIKRQSGIAPDLWAAESLVKVFDAVGVEYPKTAKTGAPSFRKEWLEHHDHPITSLIRDARNLDKLAGTFVDGYVLKGHTNGRIHCQFNQLRSDEGGTVSGRFSSSTPNLQNIPSRTKDGKAIRRAFIPEEGQQWWKFDWSQIEYRLIVHYAALRKLPGADDVVRRYREDSATDYHQAIADLTGLDRSAAKGLNFGLAYGQGLDLLCKNLGVDRDVGRGIIQQYHRRAPFIKPLAEQASARAALHGEIRTLLRRKRRFTLWEDGGEILREERPGARRAFTHKALNALIQGSAADIMKKAMVEIFESGACDVLGAPHLTVHDELDGSLPAGPAAAEALREVEHIMTTCVELLVPLIAEGSIGPTWGDLK